MKVLTAKVVGGQLELPEDLLEEGTTVTLLVPEPEERFALDEEQEAFIRRSLSQIETGDWVDARQLLQQLRNP